MRNRRLLCVILSLLILVSAMPVSVNAAESHPNTYINSGNNRVDIIGVARTQVGYMETGNNLTKYGSWYGLQGNPWCAMVISWCARKAGISENVLRNTALARPDRQGFYINYYDGKTYTPKMGDLFFYKNYEHTGLVYLVDGEYFYSIEGNSNNDGSDNGNRVLCLKRKIADYYFGVPGYPEAEVLAAPEVSTAAKEYQCGNTVQVTWQPVENAVSYQVIAYYDGDIVYNENVGTATSFDIPSVDVGYYLISVSAKYAGGKEGFNQCAFDVTPAPTLMANYNANGGKITPEYKYMVDNTGNTGVNFRSSHYTSSSIIGWLPNGTQLAVDNKAYSGGYTWGHGYYNGKGGWFALDMCTRVGYGLDSDGQIMQYSSQSRPKTFWYSTVPDGKTLLDPQSVGLEREYYTFEGWSTNPNATAGLGKNGASVTAAEIDPGFGAEDKTVTLYAVWSKIVEAISIKSLPVKTEYYAEETLDTTGLQIQVEYADGTEAVLSEGFTVTGFNPSATGEQTITVSYGTKEVTFKVTVDARLSYTAENGTAMITDYQQGDGGVVIVPAVIGGLPVSAIADNAFADCDKITAIVISNGVTEIGQNAFNGCSALTTVNFTGSQEQWDAITIGSGNEALLSATLNCNYLVLGDYTGDMQVDNNDVIYLLWHTLFPEQFPVTMEADLNKDGKVTNEDVITLLWYSLFPEQFPLKAAMSAVEEEAVAEIPVSEENTEYTGEEPTDTSDAIAEDGIVEEVVDNTDEEVAADASDEVVGSVE